MQFVCIIKFSILTVVTKGFSWKDPPFLKHEILHANMFFRPSKTKIIMTYCRPSTGPTINQIFITMFKKYLNNLNIDMVPIDLIIYLCAVVELLDFNHNIIGI